MTLDLYRAGRSPLHRLGAGAKLAGLFVAGTGLFLIDNLAASAAALGLAAVLYIVAGLGVRIALAQLRPLWWVFLLIFAAQAVFGEAMIGIALVIRLAALMLIASLVTLTTRSSDMIAAITRGLSVLRPLGVNPARVGLTFSLALRFLPVLAQATSDVREAQAARGRGTSVIGTAIPVAVRTLKMADAVAEAIEARGGG